LALQPVDFVEGFFSRCAQRNLILPMQHQLETGGHGVTS
jgi:hypothetical protein